jgi:ribosomal protein S12 methylthiotransferase accessory factor
MQIEIDFPGGKRVDAHFGPFTLHTDQPLAGGGANSAPSPFNTFLAALGTCAGIYVLGFCQQRGLSTDGLRLVQSHVVDPDTGRLVQVTLEIMLPEGFPMKYQAAVIRAAEQCAVKKVLDHPPAFEVTAYIPQPQAMA